MANGNLRQLAAQGGIRPGIQPPGPPPQAPQQSPELFGPSQQPPPQQQAAQMVPAPNRAGGLTQEQALVTQAALQDPLILETIINTLRQQPQGQPQGGLALFGP